MIYECLTKDGKFVVAKPAGWIWSHREREEFVMEEIDLVPMPEDYMVDIASNTILASAIEPALVDAI